MTADHIRKQNGCRESIGSSINNVTFSKYYSNVTGPAMARYQEKVELCGFDPYLLNKSDCSGELAKFPCVIVEYYVLETSWPTGKQIKAYKFLEAYNFFETFFTL